MGVAEIVAQLEAVHEGLVELAYDELAKAVDAGASTRPELERRATRARNAVERALAILKDAPESDGA